MTRSAEERTPNRLIHATSPYLLQHAHNPVDWFEWGPEALERAAEEDKPILVSIGYSACHWCHVMERESFEVESIAKIMNEHFVCIKVDREERPDIDQIYMEAVQAMGVHGGWPLNVFLNPSQKPFYGGTYFPPQNWARLLLQINQVFREKRKEVDSTAEDINQSLQVSDLQRFASGAAEEEHHLSDLEKMFQLLDARFDKTWGGIEKSPKFVMPTIWQFLLRYFAATNSGEALDMVSLTLTKMSEAGLYDQLGGGFSRYSVDGEWFAPHFEKMLYDNGQLLGLYAEAFSATSNPLFRAIVSETIGWLEREMKSPEGGLYSALDADSEGVEGKFYTWTYPEWTAALAEFAPSAAKYFGVSVSGNWEHGRNILRRVTYEPLKDELFIRERLLKTRHHRIRPGLDDKMLTAWNAMAVYGLTTAYRTFGEPAYLSLAKDVIQFIESKAIAGSKVYRSFKGHRSVTEGFLEDYAFLIQAYTSLYQCTFSEHYLDQAKHWCSYTIDNFFDKKEGYFYFVGSAGESLIARKKEVFDNVIPSSNSVMARNLFALGTLLDHAPWIGQAREMVSRLKAIILSEPGYASHWGLLLAEMTIGMKEVVIVGPDAERKRMELCKHFLPFCLILGATKKSDLPLLQGRDGRDEKTRIYVCINKTCQLPVETVEEALQQINSLHP